jgi:hypothetical protein
MSVQRLAELLLLDDLDRRDRLLMILEPYNGYMDESGTHDGSEIVALAGYVSTYERWARFELEWNKVLAHRRVGVFHMTDFEARQKEFHVNNYWTPNIREQLINRLTTVAKENTSFGIGAAVRRKDYERIIPADLQQDFQDPYYLLLYFSMVLLAKWKEMIPDACRPIRFLFDRKKGFEGRASTLYYKSRELNEEQALFGDMGFGSKTECAPLQAADLIVYEVAKEGRRALSHRQGEMRRAMDVLREKMNLLVSFLEESHLNEFVKIVRASTTRKAGDPL